MTFKAKVVYLKLKKNISANILDHF